MKKILIALAAVLLLASPAMAEDSTRTTMFGGVLYEVGVYGEGDGQVWGTFLGGRHISGNIYLGLEAVSAVDSRQGGVGPSVFWVDPVNSWLSVIGDLGYLSDIIYDPDEDEYGWGLKGGLGAGIHATKRSTIVLGARFTPSQKGGGDMKTVAFGGGLFISEPLEELAGFIKKIAGLVKK